MKMSLMNMKLLRDAMNPRAILVLILIAVLLISIIFRPSLREWYEGRIASYEEEFQGAADPDQRRIQDIIEAAENYNSQSGVIKTARARAVAINTATLPDVANPTAFDNASTRFYYDETTNPPKKEFVMESCDQNTKACIKSFTLEDTPDKTGVDENDLRDLKKRYESEIADIKKMKTDWDGIKGDPAKALSFQLGIKSKLPSNKANDKAAYDELIRETETRLNNFISQESSDLTEMDKATAILDNKSNIKKPVVQKVVTAAAGVAKASAAPKKAASPSKPTPAPKAAKVEKAAKVAKAAKAPKAAAPAKASKPAKGASASARQLFTDYQNNGSNHVERFFNFMNKMRDASKEGFTGGNVSTTSHIQSYDNNGYAPYPNGESLLDMGNYIPPYMEIDSRPPLYVRNGNM